MADLPLAARGVPFVALALLGCGGAAVPNAVASNAVAPPKAEPTPTERAETLVRQRLASQAIDFDGAQVFTSQGATVVCGRYRLPDRPPLRYVAIGEEDVFVEGEFSGDMDQAVRETCRDA